MDIYKKLKDPKTGTAPTTTNASNWVYFPKINDLMANKHTITPVYSIDSSNWDDDLIEVVFDDIDDIDNSSTNEQQPTTSRNISVPPPPKKKKESLLIDHIKDRDKKMLRTIEKNNKLIKKVVEKYFPEVDISSSESD